MSYILDFILIALVVVGYIIGSKKGFIKSVWKIAALGITIATVMFLKNPAVEFVSGTPIADNIHSAIASKIHIPQGGGLNLTETLHLPKFMEPGVNSAVSGAQSAATTVNDAVTVSLTRLVILIGVCVALFIIIRLLLMVIYFLLTKAAKAPVIKGTNKLAGGILGAAHMVLLIFIAMALITMFAPAGSGIFDAIDKTYIFKYLYNYNIILQLFMK